MQVLVAVALLVLTLFVATPYVIARSQQNFEPTHNTINVFPSEVTAQNWRNVSTIGNQELGEHSIFQSFNKQNSAYIADGYNGTEWTVVGPTTGEQIDTSADTSVSDTAPYTTTSTATTADEVKLPNESSVEVETVTEPEPEVAPVTETENTVPVETTTDESIFVRTC